MKQLMDFLITLNASRSHLFIKGTFGVCPVHLKCISLNLKYMSSDQQYSHIRDPAWLTMAEQDCVRWDKCEALLSGQNNQRNIQSSGLHLKHQVGYTIGVGVGL